MNIIENEANQFYFRLYRNAKINNLENIKDNISSKLYNFNRDRDKLDFLKILREKTLIDNNKHKKNCTGCDYEKDRLTGIFAIDQEIENINKYYTFTPENEDKFSIEEESHLHNKLNLILEDLEKKGFGQQVIFDEIEDLKNHFTLGKKNWFQLLKGKLIDLTIDKVLENTIIVGIYTLLSEGFENITKLLE